MERSTRNWLAATGVGALALGVAAATTGPWRPAAESADWRHVSAVGFADVAAALLDARVTSLDVGDWTKALYDADPEVATRAAVLLGAAAADEETLPELARTAEAALLAKIETQQPAGSRFNVSVDIVAARALDRAALRDEDIAKRLASLAAPGTFSHPDLATRVECGAVALAAGQRESTIPFLLAVLRAETPDQVKSRRTWERMTTLAWVKTHAAMALSDAAGTDLRFRPDGSWAHQMAEANRLEELLENG